MINAEVTAENRPDCTKPPGKNEVSGDSSTPAQNTQNQGWYTSLHRISSGISGRVPPFLAENYCKTPLWS